jgi:hypothetical protein
MDWCNSLSASSSAAGSFGVSSTGERIAGPDRLRWLEDQIGTVPQRLCTGLRSPDGMSCCNERDCRPVAYASTRTRDGRRSTRTALGTRSSTTRHCRSPRPMGVRMPAGASGRKPGFSLYYPSWHGIPRRVQPESLLTTLFTSRQAVGTPAARDSKRCCSLAPTRSTCTDRGSIRFRGPLGWTRPRAGRDHEEVPRHPPQD